MTQFHGFPLSDCLSMLTTDKANSPQFFKGKEEHLKSLFDHLATFFTCDHKLSLTTLTYKLDSGEPTCKYLGQGHLV